MSIWAYAFWGAIIYLFLGTLNALLFIWQIHKAKKLVNRFFYSNDYRIGGTQGLLAGAGMYAVQQALEEWDAKSFYLKILSVLKMIFVWPHSLLSALSTRIKLTRGRI